MISDTQFGSGTYGPVRTYSPVRTVRYVQSGMWQLPGKLYLLTLTSSLGYVENISLLSSL